MDQQDVLVVGSKVKAYVKAKGAQSSGDLVEAVSKHVYVMLDAAVERAKGNKRMTVRDIDL